MQTDKAGGIASESQSEDARRRDSNDGRGKTRRSRKRKTAQTVTGNGPRVHLAATGVFAEHGIKWGYSNVRKQLEAAITDDPSSDIALHCQPLEGVEPIPGKTNIALTMWECSDLLAVDIPKLRQLDALIVPSKFCVRLYEKHADCPIYHVPLGVNVDEFTYVRRKPPKDQPFVFLWCASPDPRKGWGYVAHMWEAAFARDPRVLLWMKTSSADDDQRVERRSNVVIDTRRLPLGQYVELFHNAHAFLFPSLGEGFGLTAAEAMATGLPVVGSAITGQAEFMNGMTSYPIKTHVERIVAYGPGKDSTAEDKLFGVRTPDGPSMIKQMRRVMDNYSQARDRGRIGSQVIRKNFTWDKFSAGVREVLSRYGCF